MGTLIGTLSAHEDQQMDQQMDQQVDQQVWSVCLFLAPGQMFFSWEA
jgi:hypothetical protein